MSLFMNIYHKTLQENEKNLRFWEDYLQNLKSLDFSVFCDKLKVPVLVPIGSRIMFRGELKHTNEVTVALGADYFTKCSLKQAEVLRQHRINVAQSKLESFKKEREYLENQVMFSKQNVIENQGQEIIEIQTEEEDKVWRETHREKVKQWKQKGKEQSAQEEITDEELWNRLEELELQEELENELMEENNELRKDEIIIKEEEILFKATKEEKYDIEPELNNEKSAKEETKNKVIFKETIAPKVTDKFELLQKVLDKQNDLEEKIMELRNKDRSKSKTEDDLISKLDEMEALDELQDEMDRLEDIIDTEDVETEEENEDIEEESTSTSESTDSKRKVYFADEDDSETLELTFHHSDVEPCKEPYNHREGISKPSDIYEAYSNLFTETTSILKKSKYENKDSDPSIVLPKAGKKKVEWPIEDTSRTIVVNDVVEKVEVHENLTNNNNTEKRPVSLFKQLRQKKS